jgi:F-type H+-transporting ATPase subunit gamma
LSQSHSQQESTVQIQINTDHNIGESLQELNRIFQRLRRSAIEEELFDVISGFEALSGEEE